MQNGKSIWDDNILTLLSGGKHLFLTNLNNETNL